MELPTVPFGPPTYAITLLSTNRGGTSVDFGLFNTWNALYPGGKVP